jgi:hypothetical protein
MKSLCGMLEYDKLKTFEENLLTCGSPRECVNCGYVDSSKQITCKTRFCTNANCIRLRETRARATLKPRFSKYRHLRTLTLTRKYMDFPLKSKKDVQAFHKKASKLLKLICKSFPISNVIYLHDVVKKGADLFHLHAHISFECPINRISAVKLRKIISSNWEGRAELKYKPLKAQQKSALNYFVKRVASINPIPKDSRYLWKKLSISEYFNLFHKLHFIHYHFWSEGIELESSILVYRGHTVTTDFCPNCRLNPFVPIYVGYDPPEHALMTSLPDFYTAGYSGRIKSSKKNNL